MAKSFTADLKNLTEKAKANINYIAKMSIQDVLIGAQTHQKKAAERGGPPERGKIPVDSSDLVNSLTVEGRKGEFAYAVAIADMKMGDVLEFAWTQPYSARIEYGWTTSTGREVPGAFFVGENAANFQEFVDKRAAEVSK